MGFETHLERMTAEMNRLRQEVAKWKAECERFHDPMCPHKNDTLIGNCCESNDAALQGVHHWREVDRLRAENERLRADLRDFQEHDRHYLERRD